MNSVLEAKQSHRAWEWEKKHSETRGMRWAVVVEDRADLSPLVDFSESHPGVRDICVKSDASISPFKKTKPKKKHLEESEGGEKQTKKL